MKDESWRGPALRDVATNDAEALQHLFAEQRARLGVVREHELWQWFGGVPRGFSSGKEVLWGVFLPLIAYGAVFIALIVAGFTQGPVLWALFAVPLLCGLLHVTVVRPPVQKTLRLYRRAELWPAVVVAHDAAAARNDEGTCPVAALVPRERLASPDLTGLLAAAQRVTRWLAGKDVPPDAVAFVAAICAGIAANDHDDSRVAAPASLGAFDLARLNVTPAVLPGGALRSRLLFVFLDPATRGPGHTRQVQDSLWGEGAASLCAALPLEGDA